jgi:hypothetical protein
MAAPANSQFRNVMRVISPSASVARAKKCRRRRNVGVPVTSATATATAAPAGAPIHGLTAYRLSRMELVYAPRPKNTAWPNESWPAYPPSRFHA